MMDDLTYRWPMTAGAALLAVAPIVALAAIIHFYETPSCRPTAITGPLPSAAEVELAECRQELDHAIDTYSEAMVRLKGQDDSLAAAVSYIAQCAASVAPR
jgi:hypothetical protein